MSSPSSHPLVTAPPGRSLARLATPAIIGVTIQSLISVSEAWYLGQLGKTALAGVALVFPIYMLATMLSAGAIGGAVSGTVARALGGENVPLAEGALRISQVVALAGGLIMAALFFGFGRQFFVLLGGKNDVLLVAMEYAGMLMPGIVTVWLYNMCSAVLRGSGDMIRPACAIAVVAVSHFCLCGMFVYGFGPVPAMGVRGAALAIVIAYLIGWIVLLFILAKPNARVRFKTGGLPSQAVKPILRNGLLAGNQSVFTIALALTTTAIIARFGETWLAGYGIGVRLELLMVPVIFGFGSALIAITGANVGAGLRERAIRIAWTGVIINAIMIGAIGLTLSFFPDIWSGLFTENPEVAAACNLYLNIVGPFYVFFALGLCLYFASQGLDTLIIPVLGTVLRYSIVTTVGLYLLGQPDVTPSKIFVLVSAALVIYGLFIAAGLRFGPWRPGRS